MADLGNLNARLALVCGTCALIPPTGVTMGVVQAHFKGEHDTDHVTLELRPICPCGQAMTVAVAVDDGRPRFKDHAVCAACGSTGFVKRGT